MKVASEDISNYAFVTLQRGTCRSPNSVFGSDRIEVIFNWFDEAVEGKQTQKFHAVLVQYLLRKILQNPISSADLVKNSLLR